MTSATLTSRPGSGRHELLPFDPVDELVDAEMDWHLTATHWGAFSGADEQRILDALEYSLHGAAKACNRLELVAAAIAKGVVDCVQVEESEAEFPAERHVNLPRATNALLRSILETCATFQRRAARLRRGHELRSRFDSVMRHADTLLMRVSRRLA